MKKNYMCCKLGYCNAALHMREEVINQGANDMNKHFAIDANGQRHTRNGKGRTYSHVVVGRWNYAADLANAQSYDKSGLHRLNYKYYAAYVDGTSQYLARKSWEQDDDAYAARVAKEVADAVKAIGGAASLEEYRQMQRDAAIANVEANKAAGKYEVYRDLGWAGRLDLAQKNAGSQSGQYTDIQILEAQRA